MSKYLGKYRIISTYITVADYEHILMAIKRNIRDRHKLLISPLASHTLVKAHTDKRLHEVLNAFDGLYPDSQWVKRSLYFLHNIRLKERVYGPQLMLRICELAEKSSYRIFLYGTTNTVLIRLASHLRQSFPQISICGMVPSVYRRLSDNEKKRIIDQIILAKTDILFISLGSPLEQIFAYSMFFERPRINVPLIIVPVGAAFDFISRTKPQAPKMLGDLGMEWLFRLISEPSRLWKRYLVDGGLFVYYIILQRLGVLSENDQIV